MPLSLVFSAQIFIVYCRDAKSGFWGLLIAIGKEKQTMRFAIVIYIYKTQKFKKILKNYLI